MTSESGSLVLHPSNRVPRPHVSQPQTANHEAELRVLRDLWREELSHSTDRSGPGASLAYVAEHFAMEMTLQRRLRVLDQMTPFLHGRVLEWGCQCAIDSCVYRLRFGDAIDLHGADLFEPGTYPVFHDFSGLQYRKLNDHVRIDYPDEFFDVVTSNGVLEHVLDDVGSVCEVDRILKPGGLFLIHCLPNAWSYTEAIQRTLGHNAHTKLYTHDFMRRFLSNTRLRVIDSGYAFVLPTMLYGFPGWAKAAFERLGPLLWNVNQLLERTWPFYLMASNLWLVAWKLPHDQAR